MVFRTSHFPGNIRLAVDYADRDSPVRVHLEAFSPFIPLDLEDSTYPATFLNYTVENQSGEAVTCTVGGWMENAAGISTRKRTAILLENKVSGNSRYTEINFGMKEVPSEGKPSIPDAGSMALAILGAHSGGSSAGLGF